ncbi:MAG: hypothetical protein ACYS1A_06520 [Planctomycetota bacterium]|jgi:predicted small secreted protein
MITKAFFILVLVVLLSLLIGCQTVQGQGGDIKWTGEKVAELLE